MEDELKIDKVRHLGERIKAGGSDGKVARDELINDYLYLAESVSKKYGAKEDYLDVAYLALAEAAEKYWKNNRKMKFSTYVVFQIKKAITKERCNELNVPAHVYEDICRLLKVEAELINIVGQEPSDDEIAKALKTDVRNVRKMKNYLQPSIAIGEEHEYEAGCIRESSIIDKYAEKDFEEIEKKEKRKEIESILMEMEEVDRRIIILKTGYGGETPLSFEAIGRQPDIQLGKDAVRRHYIRAKNYLKDKLRGDSRIVSEDKDIDKAQSMCKNMSHSSFEEYLDDLMLNVAKRKMGNEEDAQRWLFERKVEINNNIGGRKEFFKAKHLKKYLHNKNRKYVLLMIAFELRLSIAEVEELLNNAGISFSPYIDGDVEIIDLIVDGEYDIEILKKFSK